MTTLKHKIGFIGLGHMGHPMAMNLLKAGHEVTVYDVQAEAIASLVSLGALPATSVATLAAHCEIVITSLQTGNQVESVSLGEQGIFAHLKPGHIYIDTSSINIATTRALHELAQKAQIIMVDAPVSGGVHGAEQASLTIMVGGSETAFAKAKPILDFLGKRVIHAGAAGSGQAAKVCNNLLLGISMIGVSEAFVLAEKLGLHPKTFFEISSQASGQCWAMTSYCPMPNVLENVPANHNYEPGFMAKMMLKDLRLAQHAAESVNLPIPLGAITTELYELFVNLGGAEKDFSGIIQLLMKDDSHE